MDLTLPIALASLKNPLVLAAIVWVLVEFVFRGLADWIGRLLRVPVPTRFVVWLITAGLYLAAYAVDTPLTWTLILSLLLSSVIIAWGTSEADQQLLKRLVERYLGKTEETGEPSTIDGAAEEPPLSGSEIGA